MARTKSLYEVSELKCGHSNESENLMRLGFAPSGRQRYGCKICRRQRSHDRIAGERVKQGLPPRPLERVHPDSRLKRF